MRDQGTVSLATDPLYNEFTFLKQELRAISGKGFIFARSAKEERKRHKARVDGDMRR